MKGLPLSPFTPKSEGVCILGMGDCGSKASSKSTIDIETLNKSVSNFLSEKAASATASAVNVNDMTIEIGELRGGCDIDASQKITSTVKALASMDSVDTKELQNTIKNAANAQVDQAAQAKTGFFATAPSDSKTVSDYKNKVSNIVETNITDKQKTDAFASVFNKNTKALKIGICGDGPGATNSAKMNASQNIQSDLVAQALLKSVSSVLTTLDASNTTSVAVSQAATAKSSGLDDVIAAIFAGLTGIYGIIACVIIVICIGVCCAFMMLGGEAKNAVGSAAAAAIPAAPPGLMISAPVAAPVGNLKA